MAGQFFGGGTNAFGQPDGKLGHSEIDHKAFIAQLLFRF